MSTPKIYAHGSYIGTTGYNNHTRDFFRELSNHFQIKFRNFTVGKSWDGYNMTPHDNEPYLNDTDKKLLYKQVLWTGDGNRDDFDIYSSEEKNFSPDLNIVLNETNHHLFFENYGGPKIAYNVWESTLQPEGFFNKLLEFDEIWVPSKWQQECTIKQGAPESMVKVVPEGVDVHTFFPEEVDKLDEYNDGRFKFLLFGRWDYRKSTKEIIQTFLNTFGPEEPIDLVVSIDNMWGEQMDGMKSTQERLEHYGLNDERIKIISFPSREDYIKYIKTGHVFVSCARSEGWNLPLIEAMACGTPSIYSNCSAQLEFAEGKGFPVNIVGERPANSNDYGRYTMSDLPGNYYEPDFNHLSQVMRYIYENYEECKNKSLTESENLRNTFSWENVALIGKDVINDFVDRKPWLNKPKKQNRINVNYIDGPKVEILGDDEEEYFIEFIDGSTNKVVHSDNITTGMWTSCSRKYYTPWIIKVNGEIVDEFKLEGETVLISLESGSLGDTLAWSPYAVELQKKHNCNVVLSTHHNHFFKGLKEYENIKFITPGESVGCKVVYRIGWFKDENGTWEKFDMYPNRVNTIPLQQTATDILGLEYKEVNHGVNFSKGEKPMEKEYVVFGPNTTAGCKEWTYENWVSLSKLIKELGYEVVTLTQKPFNIEGVTNVWGEPFTVVANYLHHAKAFIGLGSGLSWFNWSLNKHTYMINGFARDGHEFSNNITRIYNPDTCIYCWNDEVFTFDTGDWDWCPVYKGTKKQHICQKSITPLQVFNYLSI